MSVKFNVISFITSSPPLNVNCNPLTKIPYTPLIKYLETPANYFFHMEYKMVTQNLLRTHEGKKVFSDTALGLIKCL